MQCSNKYHTKRECIQTDEPGLGLSAIHRLGYTLLTDRLGPVPLGEIEFTDLSGIGRGYALGKAVLVPPSECGRASTESIVSVHHDSNNLGGA